MDEQRRNKKATTSQLGSTLRQMIHEMPKVELHRHLEGSWRLSSLAGIASKYQLDLPGYGMDEFRHMVQVIPSDPPTMANYLSKFATLRQFYHSPETIHRVAYEAVEDAAADNVHYMELRFTPIALGKLKGFALADVMDWVLSAVEQGQADFGITVRLLVSMNRHEDPAIGEQFIDLAIANQHRGIVGVDLAGAEATHEAAPFIPVFRKARDAGLSVTIHAGEWGGPENVRQAIQDLGASRIGHGVRVLEDPDVVALALAKEVVFEVCPTSNFQSGVFEGWRQHPLKRMADAGLKTTINTDNTLVSAIDLTDEIGMAMRYLGFSTDEVKGQILNAAQAAFLSDEDRRNIVEYFNEALYPDDNSRG